MEEVSKRLIDQRIRNRIMEVLLELVEWQESLRKAGFVEYFEAYFDWAPYEGEPHPNRAMTEAEYEALRQVQCLMIEAVNATPKNMSEELFVATGWPQRIGPVAEEALRLMLRRGRFSEYAEEIEPSSDDSWPRSDRFRPPV